MMHRAWNKDTKEMLYGGFCIMPDGTPMILRNSEGLDDAINAYYKGISKAKLFLHRNYSEIDYTDFSGYNLKVMRSTGVNDMNGKLIWEGDILYHKYYRVNIKWRSSVSEISRIKEQTEEGRIKFQVVKDFVSFKDGGFCFGYKPLSFIGIRINKITDKVVTGSQHNCDYEEKWWDFEVVGNICEHPELLKYEE